MELVPDVGRVLELLVVHSSGCSHDEDRYTALMRDVIACLGMDAITIVVDTPRRVQLVTVPTVWTVYDLLRLFGNVQMVATRRMVVGEPMPTDKTLASLLIAEDEVIFLRSGSGWPTP